MLSSVFSVFSLSVLYSQTFASLYALGQIKKNERKMSRTLILWNSTVCVLRDHHQVIDMFIAVDGHVVHRLSGYVLAKTVRQTQ